MTTLVLQAADNLIGGVANAATSFLGQAVSGLFDGEAAAGSDSVRLTSGPRLRDMAGLGSTEGAPIPRLHGRARIGGQLIWATRFEEVATTTSATTTSATTTGERPSAARGGKSLAGRGSRAAATAGAKTTTVTTTYSYFANLAIGICEGPVALIRRVWADGREVDLTTVAMRVYPGTEGQEADPLILAKEAAGEVPAYRGLAYVVFERLPLGPYGNRVPQFSFEVIRATDGLRQMIRSVCLIPGATEFGYDTVPIARDLGLGATATENVHQLNRLSDLPAALDALQALCPNVRHVSLVVSWFGDDLRAGACTVAPRVDLGAKATLGAEWSVSGLPRAAARETSRALGVAAYGGTPSDASVIRAIAELRARGLEVTLYPFLMMDVPAENVLPDPRTGAAGQPAYPWRGRITCDPAPGRPSSPDGGALADAQVAAFFGTVSPGNFGIYGGEVSYGGPEEWSFRRLVLHCAHLAAAAGGVDGFVIGSELVGLTRVRGAGDAYPAVTALRALAADLRHVLGFATKLTYAADWTEYGSHVLAGGQEVRFPLDPLWADPNIDAVGIDYYPPVSDWRAGGDQADGAEARGPADLAYLRRRLGSGEAFDWYYRDEAERRAQLRTPITDGAYGKPWIYRAKDLVSWWSHAHVERSGGVETAPTGWAPGSKPIWLTEVGIPAVDRGGNGPNVFPDPKSSESAAPPFSDGSRDDLVQIRGLEAILSRFDPALPGHPPGANPASPVYPGLMIDPARISVWCWDARPFPAFPEFDQVWADGRNWDKGHWITGRIEGAPLDRLVAAILADFGLDPTGAEELDGFVDGYVIDRPMSAREALQPLCDLFGFDAVPSGGRIAFRGRGGRVAATIGRDDLVAPDDGPLFSRTRSQESELAGAVELGFTDSTGEYRRATALSRRLAGASRRLLASDLAIVADRAQAQRLAETRLQDIWAGRDTVELSLSPRALALEPGDVVAMAELPGAPLFRVTRVTDGLSRRITARAVEPAVFGPPPAPVAARIRRAAPSIAGPAHPVLLDLPAGGRVPQALKYLAVAADPWPGAVAVWRSADEVRYDLHRIVSAPAVIGRALTAVPPGPVWRWDRATVVEVELSAAGALSSIDEEAALAGGNLLAFVGPDGDAEVASTRIVTLIGPRRYRLSGFLRGLGGTERLAARTLPPGSAIVVLDGAVVPVADTLSEIGQSWRYQVGPADRDRTDPSVVEVAGTVGATALMPLAPVRIKARRTPDGVALSWIRRARLDGDAWEVAEIPLGEESERYEVDIRMGGATLRTLAAAGPQAVYPAGAELADFGASQAVLDVAVFQLSAVAGRGFPAAMTVPVD